MSKIVGVWCNGIPLAVARNRLAAIMIVREHSGTNRPTHVMGYAYDNEREYYSANGNEYMLSTSNGGAYRPVAELNAPIRELGY